MQRLAEVRRRAASVRSIRSVASTLATVASAKLSRTRERAAGMRRYSEAMRAIVERQQAAAARAGIDLSELSPFMRPHDCVRAVLLLHISGDRGMCGSYNSAIDREAAAFIRGSTEAGVAVRVYAKGTKGEKFVRNRTSAEIVGASGWSRAGVTDDEVDTLHAAISDAFLTGGADEVWCTYTRFFSPMRRMPTAVRLLPLAFGERDPAATATEQVAARWFYEPSRAATVGELLAIFLRLQVRDVLLESYAAEQGARMITMEEATERADRSLQELTVTANRLRREVITSDLLGILFARSLRGHGDVSAATTGEGAS